ncbi:uncharacterized protein LOC118516953 isoform X2 [Anopheles stephensi]|uniref:uncharacterized protein LOC118516953 isoform X2 n=1 Tax=Anopheles stephensi TaxID=30069 RepID=UPI0016588DFC|nr:uncharacterized protein LOC118516953 isoform X2 [Anopheles stephensi]
MSQNSGKSAFQLFRAEYTEKQKAKGVIFANRSHAKQVCHMKWEEMAHEQRGTYFAQARMCNKLCFQEQPSGRSPTVHPGTVIESNTSVVEFEQAPSSTEGSDSRDLASNDGEASAIIESGTTTHRPDTAEGSTEICWSWFARYLNDGEASAFTTTPRPDMAESSTEDWSWYDLYSNDDEASTIIESDTTTPRLDMVESSTEYCGWDSHDRCSNDGDASTMMESGGTTTRLDKLKKLTSMTDYWESLFSNEGESSTMANSGRKVCCSHCRFSNDNETSADGNFGSTTSRQNLLKPAEGNEDFWEWDPRARFSDGNQASAMTYSVGTTSQQAEYCAAFRFGLPTIPEEFGSGTEL